MEKEQQAEKIVELSPDNLGKLLIEINIDTNRFNIGFSVPAVAQLLNRVEVENIFSPFHAACIINEIRRRSEHKIIEPKKGLIIH